MTKSLRKDFQREIKKSITRFISIMLIVALGVAFYSGVRSTLPAMHMTADAVYDKETLMDVRIVGTLGLTDDDFEAIKAIEGIETIEGSYTTDFLCFNNSKEIVTRVISMPKVINDISLTEGNFPTEYNHCVASREFLEESGLKIGDTLTLSTGTDKGVDETLATDTYKIVGVCSSSYYLNGDIGTSTVGDGMGDGFIVVPTEAFVTDIYTSIYITVAGAKALNCFGTDYENLVSGVIKDIKEISQKQCDLRYSNIRLETSRILEEARSKYTVASTTVQDEIQNAADELAAKKALIEQSRAEIAQNKELLENAEENLPIAQQEVKNAQDRIAAAEALILVANQGIEEITPQIEDMEAKISEMEKDPNVDKAQLAADKKRVAEMKKQLNNFSLWIDTQEIQVEQGKRDLIQAQVVVGQLQNAVAQKGSLEIAEQEIVDADKLLQEANEQYEAYKTQALEELSEAEEQLTDLENEISNIESPVWHVLDRNSIESHASFVNESDSIGAIGTVFPIIFFLVAALVSLTTMTRMVEEERIQIGTLKALGYDKLSIILKYLLYALAATVAGSFIGVILGELTIPPIIIGVYRSVYYNLGKNVMGLNLYHALSASLVAILCTTLATLFACQKALRSEPAALMRPEAPKAGKRTFIENFSFIWQRLDFGQKSALRNLFRYKKRFFMTLFGVGGCMALLIVGLGIRDSVNAMAKNQYNDVFQYSAIVSVDPSISRAERRTMLGKIQDTQGIKGVLPANRTIISASGSATTEIEDEKKAYLVVPTDVDAFGNFISLQERTGDREDVNLLSDGVVITEKYADMLGVKLNDYIYIKIDESTVSAKEVKVLGIAENYIFNYVYMTPGLYQSLYGVEADINILMVNTARGFEGDDLKTALTGIDGVNSIITNEDELEGINKVIKNLYFIIIIMVVSAAVLAFVVLYNLNNINISERRRELATFKLLGFYDYELAKYVYRENIILTFLGIILGIVLGVIIHRFVMITVETDVYMFGRELSFLSILIATILTVLFTVAVNLLMKMRLKKIDMIESLKSVE